MPYSVRIEWVGEAVAPEGVPLLRQSDIEPEASALAIKPVGGNGPQRVAAVLSASSALVLTYAGGAPRGML